MLPAQVQESVLQAQGLGGGILLCDLEGNDLRLAKDLHLLGDDLDLAGRQLGVDRVWKPPDDLSGEPDDGLDAPVLEGSIELALWVDHHLGEPVAVAQIDENDPAMVAHAVDPARKADLDPDVLFTQLPAVVCPISVFLHHRTL